MAEVAKYVSPIADPLIKPDGKLHQKVLKLMKKAHGSKAVRRGVPEITKLLRKGKKGVVVLAADIFPVELIAHMPVLCEENDVLYAYVSSREELGASIGSKRPVSVVFVPKPAAESVYESAYGSVEEGLTAIHPYMGENKKAVVEEEDGDAKKEKKEKKAKKAKKEE